jgi:hypothetical protein
MFRVLVGGIVGHARVIKLVLRDQKYLGWWGGWRLNRPRFERLGGGSCMDLLTQTGELARLLRWFCCGSPTSISGVERLEVALF